MKWPWSKREENALAWRALEFERILKEQMMKVEYTVKHHDDKPCEREVIIPKGYERVEDVDMASKDYLMRRFDRDNEWWGPFEIDVFCGAAMFGMATVIRPIKRITLEAGGYYEVEGGAIIPYNESGRVSIGGVEFIFGRNALTGVGINQHYIAPRILRRVWVSDSEPRIHIDVRESNASGERFENAVKEAQRLMDKMPKAARKTLLAALLRDDAEKPFRLSGPGWYKHRDGSWRKVSDETLAKMLRTEKSLGGFWAGTDDLIARATPEQANVLEGLG